MKTTRFNEIHRKAGAKMVEFAGFEMPIQYSKGIIHEHNKVRNEVGVFDVSHMGEFEIRGKDALAFAQNLTINDVSKLKVGDVQYSAMCYPEGGIVDDLLVYNMGDYFMFVVNGANIDKDWNWCIENAKGFDVDLQNVSDEINLLAVQGPNSRAVIQKLTDTDISEENLIFYNYKLGKVAGVDMIISRTGYTGELGYELYFRGDEAIAEKIWNAIFEEGADFGIEPVGLACRDTLRLEKGYCLYGNDITKETNPIEAGLGWITKAEKGDFNGSEFIKRVKADKPLRRLVGFEVKAEKFIPRHNYLIYKGDLQVGFVTSGTMSPTLKKPIGMAYVPFEEKNVGNILEIEARGKRFPIEIVKIPFLK